MQESLKLISCIQSVWKEDFSVLERERESQGEKREEGRQMRDT